MRIPVKIEQDGQVTMLELGEGELVRLRNALAKACDHEWVGAGVGVCYKCGKAWEDVVREHAKAPAPGVPDCACTGCGCLNCGKGSEACSGPPVPGCACSACEAAIRDRSGCTCLRG